MKSGRDRRRIRNFLLNRRYQLTFTFFMVALCAIPMIVLGYLVMETGRAATTVGINTVEANAAYLPDARLEVARLHATERRLAQILVGTGALLGVGLFLYGIRMTHRAAGPLYKVGTYLEEIRAGKYGSVARLRSGDHLNRFYESFARAHEALKKGEEDDVAALSGVLEVFSKSRTSNSEVEARLQELAELQRSKEVGLGR